MKNNKVKEYRERNRLTQFDLAIKIRVTPQTIGNIENGRSTPRFVTQRSLAEALGTSVDELFPRDESGPTSGLSMAFA